MSALALLPVRPTSSRLLRRLRRVSALGALSLAACGGDKVDGDPTGLGGGGGSAAIRATVDGKAWSSNFIGTAVVQLAPASGGVSMVQVTGTQREGNNPTQIIITLTHMGTFSAGTYPLGPTGQGGATGYSGAGNYAVGVGSNFWASNIRDGANSGSGSVTFTTLTPTRVAGTFQFTAVPTPGNPTTDRKPVVITGGTFDVPVVAAP